MSKAIGKIWKWWRCRSIGDGSDDDADKEMEIFDGSDKKNFLIGGSPAVLYLWNKVEEHDLMESVTQQLSTTTAIDSLSSLDSISVSSIRKRKMIEESRMDILKVSIDEANKIERKTFEIEKQKIPPNLPIAHGVVLWYFYRFS